MKRLWWVVDLLLMPVAGVLGLFVAFMFFVSEHPTVDSNWLVWVFNPLPLCCMPWVVWSAVKHRLCAYHYLNAVMLASFLIASPWIPQYLGAPAVILVASLLWRPLSYLYDFHRLKPSMNPRRTSSRKKK